MSLNHKVKLQKTQDLGAQLYGDENLDDLIFESNKQEMTSRPITPLLDQPLATASSDLDKFDFIQADTSMVMGSVRGDDDDVITTI